MTTTVSDMDRASSWSWVTKTKVMPVCFWMLFQLHLHVLAQLQVQGAQGLVQQQDLGAGHQGPGDGHPLLLAAGQAGDSCGFQNRSGPPERASRATLASISPLGTLLLPKGEGHVFKDVQVGKEGILLKNSVDVPFVGGHVVDFLAQEEDFALIRGLKAADEPAAWWSFRSREGPSRVINSLS